MSEKFFKGFSLEDYRLQLLVNKLEKEKQQCLNRLNEEKHMFKMSLRLPVKSGEEYWSHYGENFRANGDKIERWSLACSPTSRKEHDREAHAANRDKTIPSNEEGENLRRSSPTPEDNTPENSVDNLKTESVRNTPDRFENRERKSADSIHKKPKSVGPTLLEILCGDFENGILLLDPADRDSSDLHIVTTDSTDDHSKSKQNDRLKKKQLLLKSLQSDRKGKNSAHTDKNRKRRDNQRTLSRETTSQESRESRIIKKSESPCFDEDELRTRSLGLTGSWSSRNGGVKTCQWRKSQDEIDKETREKMDQFFAKVESTKHFQTRKQRWRCGSARDTDRKICVEGKISQRAKKTHGYRRAEPWPTEVWS